MSQEKLKTMPMHFFFWGGGGVKEVYYGICASSELDEYWGRLANTVQSYSRTDRISEQ